MFEFTSKAKRWAYILIFVGVVGVVIGFMNNGSSHESHEGDDHAQTEAHADGHDDHATHDAGHEEDATAHGAHADSHGGHDAGSAHQQATRPWAALFVNAIFFLGIGIGALFFLAIQYAAQVGWSAGLLRIMEAQALWLIVPLIVVILIVVAGLGHMHHLWHWMEEGIMVKGEPNYDPIIAGKEGFLNPIFTIVRNLLYLVIWGGAAFYFRKQSLKQDLTGDSSIWVKTRKSAAIFLVLYAVTSSVSAWDWIMSIDAHWFSTLFGWYTFAGMFVSALTVLAMLTIYLKSKGYLEWINSSHIQDLGKFMFAFSIFWTYLWFSQYMLYWYSNIPEEVTYFMQRFDQYKLMFILMVVFNFVFPILIVMSRDAKRVPGLVIFAGIFVILGHWIDHFVMIMPGSVGAAYGIGLVEIGGFVMFAGLFILIVFTNLSKAPLLQKNHPMLKEGNNFHQ
jgi:hypothetical protein